MVIGGSGQERKGLEALAIAEHGQQGGASPTVHFGRMPFGYRMSSGIVSPMRIANFASYAPVRSSDSEFEKKLRRWLEENLGVSQFRKQLRS